MLFIKRHKKLSLLFAVSVFLMIKNSSIPYFFNPPVFITLIFDAPKSELFREVAKIVDVFASAYVTSLLFYYMVDVLPAIKQEKRAKEILSPKLVDLYLYISEFLAMIEYSAKKQKLYYSENVDAMDKLSIKNEETICKQKSYKNEKEYGTAIYPYNLLKDGDKLRTLVLNTCSEISSTPSFSFCDTQIIGLISEIQLSELLRMWPKLDEFSISYKIENQGLGKDYGHLKLLTERLSGFVDPRLGCEMTDISSEEVEEWERDKTEALKQYPQMAEIMAEFYTKNKQ